MNAWRNARHAPRTIGRRAGRMGACLGVLLLVGLAGPRPAKAAPGPSSDNNGSNDVTFDRSLLSGGGRNTVDLARFEHDQVVVPGEYNVDVYVNNVDTGRTNVRFAAPPGHPGQVHACFTPALLGMTRLKPKLTQAQQARLRNPSACVRIGRLLSGATTQFDLNDLRLDVSVPQASMSQLPRGYVAPANLSRGVNAAMLNYSLNAYRFRSQGVSHTSAFANLDAGLNLDHWHFRHTSTLDWQSAVGALPSRRHWQNVRSYVEREIPSLDAQLTLGDTYTRGELFDSVSLSGVQLGTDPRMLPSSQRGYAPVVRGVARTNAKVTIRQNGVVIYEATVAPGPFAIRDLYPTGYGGNLDVQVQEADGSVQRYSVPYASVPQLLRSGTTYFHLASGHLRNPALVWHPLVTEGTLRHGFSNLFTGYTGVIGTRGYFAWLLGMAMNTRWGALALDTTAARTKIPGVVTTKGRSYRLSYSKILPGSDTSISIAAYRYSTRGYLGLTDAMLARDYARRGLTVFATAPPHAGGTSPGTSAAPGILAPSNVSTPASLYTGGIDRMRSRFSITLNQRLGARAGSVFLNAWTRDYWNRGQRDTQFQLGYNNRFDGIGLNLTATRSRDGLGRYDTQVYASISLPLGGAARAPMFTASLARDSRQGWQQQATLNGSAGADNQFNYGATASHATATGDTSGSINGGYRSAYSVLQASLGQGPGYRQASLGMSGAVVAHPGGVTFGQPIGDTVGIVVAPHATGALVNNAAGARVDQDGFALVPYLTPYTYNQVSLDPGKLPLDVQLDSTSARVAPPAGAVVMIPFQTQYGRSLVVVARLADGKMLPFGARVKSAHGQSLGVVGQGGQMLLRGVHERGTVQVRWTNAAGAARGCAFSYTLPKHAGGGAYPSIDAVCRPDRPARGGSS